MGFRVVVNSTSKRIKLQEKSSAKIAYMRNKHTQILSTRIKYMSSISGQSESHHTYHNQQLFAVHATTNKNLVHIFADAFAAAVVAAWERYSPA